MPDVERIDSVVMENGARIALSREGARWLVRVDGRILMSSETHGSEEALAELACAGLHEVRAARVLVGGLGMGFTLRAALDRLAADARVDVAELVPAVVAWNRGPLAHLASRPLDDARVQVHVTDVAALLGGPGSFDAILLDVDNGPEAFSTPRNDALYDAGGLARLRASLRPGGRLGVWSAFRDARFERRMARAGLDARTVAVRARGRVRKGARHVIFVGRRPA